MLANQRSSSLVDKLENTNKLPPLRICIASLGFNLQWLSRISVYPGNAEEWTWEFQHAQQSPKAWTSRLQHWHTWKGTSTPTYHVVKGHMGVSVINFQLSGGTLCAKLRSLTPLSSAELLKNIKKHAQCAVQQSMLLNNKAQWIICIQLDAECLSYHKYPHMKTAGGFGGPLTSFFCLLYQLYDF